MGLPCSTKFPPHLGLWLGEIFPHICRQTSAQIEIKLGERNPSQITLCSCSAEFPSFSGLWLVEHLFSLIFTQTAYCTDIRLNLVSKVIGGLVNFWWHSADFCRALASDCLHSFCPFVGSLLIGLSSNLRVKLILALPTPDQLLVTLHGFPVFSGPLICLAVSVHLQTNGWSDSAGIRQIISLRAPLVWSIIGTLRWIPAISWPRAMRLPAFADKLCILTNSVGFSINSVGELIMGLPWLVEILVTIHWIPIVFRHLIGRVISAHLQTRRWLDLARTWWADNSWASLPQPD